MFVGLKMVLMSWFMSWVYWVLSVVRFCSRVGMMLNGNCVVVFESVVVIVLVLFVRVVVYFVVVVWLVSLDGLVVCGGVVNGVSCEVVVEELV